MSDPLHVRVDRGLSNALERLNTLGAISSVPHPLGDGLFNRLTPAGVLRYAREAWQWPDLEVFHFSSEQSIHGLNEGYAAILSDDEAIVAPEQEVVLVVLLERRVKALAAAFLGIEEGEA